MKRISRKIYDPFEKNGPQPTRDYVPKKINTTKRVYSWGLATTGCLGNPNFVDPIPEKKRQLKPLYQMPEPSPVVFFKDFKNIVDIAAGHGFTLYAVRKESRDRSSSLYGTGINAYNQLGRQEFKGKRLDLLIEPVPIHLPLDPDDLIAKVAAGRSHSVVLTEKTHTILSFGNNCYGQLGRPVIEKEDYKNVAHFHSIEIPERVIDIVCGQDHTLFLTNEGSVYACGLSADGQTGVGSFKNISHPTRLKGDIEGEKILQVSCCADTCLAVNDRGDVFGWGNSEYLQLSLATQEMQINSPIRLPLDSSIGKVKRVTAGGSSCGLINERNEVYVWGFGILGKGPKVDQLDKPSLIPKAIFSCDDLTGNKDNQIVDVVSGLRHFAAISAQGDLYCWGKNRNGCLGLGGPKNPSQPPDYFFPMKVDLAGGVIKVSLGVDHTVALTKNIL
jgi:alpha-tubulin suppressor-like RCC1 family protein